MLKSKWTQIDEILKGDYSGKVIHIRGWIYRTRSSGNIVFMILRDVTGVLQATVKKGNLPDSEFEHALKALIESSVQITGTVKEDKRAPGGYELQVTNLTVEFCRTISHYQGSKPRITS
jgi:asparaginyl-tRNA synthetase